MDTTITIFLDRNDGGLLHIEVPQKEIMDAGVIIYRKDFFVYDSKRSSPARPIFVLVEAIEVF